MPISQLGSISSQTAGSYSTLQMLNDNTDVAEASQAVSEAAYKLDLSYQVLEMALDTQKQVATLVTG